MLVAHWVRVILPWLVLFIVLAGSHDIVAATQSSSNEFYLYISRMDYPREVLVNSTFRISVHVNYSLPMMSQYSVEPSTWSVAARLYNSTGDTPFKENFIATSSVDELIGTGSRLCLITASAPPFETTMNLTVFAMYKSSYGHTGEEGWLYTHEPNSLVGIMITVSTATYLHLNVNNIQIPVVIDGFEHHVTDEAGRLEIRLSGLRWHLIEVPERIDLAPLARGVFVSWNDGSPLPERQVYTFGTNMTVAATYKKQFFLKVNNNDGTGWYDAGSYANITAGRERRAEGFLGLVGFVNVFRGWHGDLDSNDRTARILMEGPHEVCADWSIAYRPRPAEVAFAAFLFVAAFLALLYRAQLGRVTRHFKEDILHRPRDRGLKNSPDRIQISTCER